MSKRLSAQSSLLSWVKKLPKPDVEHTSVQAVFLDEGNSQNVQENIIEQVNFESQDDLPISRSTQVPVTKPPAQVTPNRSYYFQENWLKEYPWAVLNDCRDKLLCNVCCKAYKLNLFPSTLQLQKCFIETGFSNWKKGKEKLSEHLKSNQHSIAVLKLKAISSDPISSTLKSAIAKSQEAARTALKSMFSSMMFLTKNGLAIQGHTHDSGNYLSLLDLRSRDIPELKEFLKRSRPFTSTDIQNEMIQIISNAVLRQKVKFIQTFQEFSLIVDETTDVSTKEQVSICIRNVDENLNVHETFLGLYETSSTTGESLTQIILDILQRFGLKVKHIRGQCYDGARNMSGIYKGVSARILELEPRALFVHCYAHSLNLALQDTIKSIPLFQDALQYVHDIATVIHGSSKRLNMFLEIANNSEDKSGSKLIPQPLCPTRWTVRGRSIRSVLENYSDIMELLEEIGQSNENVSSKAYGLFCQLEKAETYFALIVCMQLITPIENLSRTIQSGTATVSGIIEVTKEVLALNNSLKAKDQFDELWDKTISEGINLSLSEPKLPRTREAPARYNKPIRNSFESPQQYYQSLYLEAIKKIVDEIQHRFQQPGIEKYKEIEMLILKWDSNRNNETGLEKICQIYELNKHILKTNLNTLHVSKGNFKTIPHLVTYIQSLEQETQSFYSELKKLLKILLLVPISSSAAERSFSLLKRIKTYLRSTINQARLNHCCILHCYPLLVDDLDLALLLQDFENCDYRRHIFGNIL